MTDKETQAIEAKCLELAAKYDTPRVHPYISEQEGQKPVIAFIKEPTYIQKMYAMDKLNSIGMLSAGDELRDILTIKEESDPITYGDTWQSDKYKLGIATLCITILEFAQNDFKKK